MLFSELSLKESSLRAIDALGFTSPTEIQEKSIPILMSGDIDFVGQAQTGTGKTAAFTLPLLEKIDFNSKKIQAIVLAPTRELANQICEEIDKLSKFQPVRTLSVYGGVPISGQIRDLKKNRPQVIVGTPGRMLDCLDRGVLELEECRFVILDEADEMLDMGFFDDVTEIVAAVANKKIWMFSATMPKPIVELINNEFCDPQMVKVTKQILTSDAIDQQFCVVKYSDMTEALCRFLDFNQNIYAIVFTRTKVGSKELTDELNMRGYPSDALHGDMSQEQRDLTMKKFKEKKINLLVCTDVAARGIDVTDLTHVINFNLPQDNESYVHRIGRTGRGGSKGVALSIIEPSEVRRIKDIERITKARIDKVTLPTVPEIVKVLIEKSFVQFEAAIENFDSENDDSFTAFVERFDGKSKLDIMKAVYNFVFEQNLKRYKNARPLDIERKERTERMDRGSDRGMSTGRGERRGGRTQPGYERFFVNMGYQAGFDPGALIRFVSRGLSIKGSEVGKIEIRDGFSFFEMPDHYTDKVLSLNKTEFNNRTVAIEVANAETSGGGASRGPRRDSSRGPRREGTAGRYESRSPATFDSKSPAKRQRHPRYTQQ
jgi:ATP-dependent RNA helicase DeaD